VAVKGGSHTGPPRRAGQAQRKNPPGSRSNKATAWPCPSAAARTRRPMLERWCSRPPAGPTSPGLVVAGRWPAVRCRLGWLVKW